MVLNCENYICNLILKGFEFFYHSMVLGKSQIMVLNVTILFFIFPETEKQRDDNM